VSTQLDTTDESIGGLGARGYTDRTIAKQLHLAVDTVGHRICRLMRQHSARNRTHLIALLMTTGALTFAHLGGTSPAATPWSATGTEARADADTDTDTDTDT
jgi:DNA-binding CsgD family transcriptional regulator